MFDSTKKNLLVTGGAGFIGSNFLRFILSQDDSFNIIVLDALKYSGHLTTITDLISSNQIIFLKGDILDHRLVLSILSEYQIDALINFAAESHVDRSIFSSLEFVQTNTLGCACLLEAAKKYWQTLPLAKKENFRFLQVSTDEVYGALGLKDERFSENSPLSPSSAYSASKASADMLCHAFYKTFNFPVIISRCTNNYGPYQYPEKLIPVILLNALSARSIPIYGQGQNIRDWIHVDDHCQGLLLCVTKGRPGQIYCIGSDHQMSNIDLTRLICDILDNHPSSTMKNHFDQLVEFVPDRKGHDFRYALNFEKIQKELGYEPKVNFIQGIKNTVNWYLNHLDWCHAVRGQS